MNVNSPSHTEKYGERSLYRTFNTSFSFAESAAKLLLFAGLYKYCLKKHRKRMFCLHVRRNFPTFAKLKNSIETQSFRTDNDQ